MKIAIVQNDIRSNDFSENLEHLETLIDQHPDADMFVLPETFATGFMPEGGVGGSDYTGYDILQWMGTKGVLYDAAVVGSVATKDDAGQLRNRLYFVRPDGKDEYYDKRHLFTFAGETKDYVPGNRRVVVEWGGVRFLLQVCYDLRFPVFSRSRGDYDAIIYVANWPESRIGAWQTLLRARAIENQCYVVGVNRVGDDHRCHYSGASAIIGPKGETLAECNNEGRTETAVADVGLLQLQHFRERFRVLDDADTCIIAT